MGDILSNLDNFVCSFATVNVSEYQELIPRVIAMLICKKNNSTHARIQYNAMQYNAIEKILWAVGWCKYETLTQTNIWRYLYKDIVIAFALWIRYDEDDIWRGRIPIYPILWEGILHWQ